MSFALNILVPNSTITVFLIVCSNYATCCLTGRQQCDQLCQPWGRPRIPAAATGKVCGVLPRRACHSQLWLCPHCGGSEAQAGAARFWGVGDRRSGQRTDLAAGWPSARLQHRLTHVWAAVSHVAHPASTL